MHGPKMRKHFWKGTNSFSRCPKNSVLGTRLFILKFRAFFQKFFLELTVAFTKKVFGSKQCFSKMRFWESKVIFSLICIFTLEKRKDFSQNSDISLIREIEVTTI